MDELFEKYKLSDAQRHIFNEIKHIPNMPSIIDNIGDEQLIWTVAVATIEMPLKPTESDLKYYSKSAEERIRRLEEAESRYGWFSLKWNKLLMRKLITNWFCGMLVIDPELQTCDGSPIQFVREYYGPESGYPDPDEQTEEWKKEAIDLYVLMARSICWAYPAATFKGIVSFSDMLDFDWNKYDMETKSRNSEIGSVIPNKLSRMICIRPDKKMKGFYKEMTPRIRRKYGFELYEDYQSALAGEVDLLPDNLPTFVGGTYKVDILKCLKYLFHREPEAFDLLLEVYNEMDKEGKLPIPKHME